jgi:hypothetical protein
MPRDGRMRNLVIDKAWFALGRLEAARYLWEMTWWEWRATATGLLLTHDPRSAVHQLVAARRWLPTTYRSTPLPRCRAVVVTMGGTQSASLRPHAPP